MPRKTKAEKDLEETCPEVELFRQIVDDRFSKLAEIIELDMNEAKESFKENIETMKANTKEECVYIHMVLKKEYETSINIAQGQYKEVKKILSEINTAMNDLKTTISSFKRNALLHQEQLDNKSFKAFSTILAAGLLGGGSGAIVVMGIIEIAKRFI